MSDQPAFHNELEIRILSGEDRRVKQTLITPNAISDDFLTGHWGIYTKSCDFASWMRLALFPDGPEWASWVWDPGDPWAPYALSENRTSDPSADPLYMTGTPSWNATVDKWQVFYQWTQLPQDFNLKALGFLGADSLLGQIQQGIVDNYSAFPVYTLAVLPSSIPIKGRLLGTQTPDILQVTYYLSVVGV